MMVMVSNNSGRQARRLASEYPGDIGHLYSPGGQRGPWLLFPYALDNGKFPCWSAAKPWNGKYYIRLLERAKSASQHPEWILVPDEVANPEMTLALWYRWAPCLRAYGWPLAFAAQDGHSPADIPKEADLVFIGGTSAWKLKAIEIFCCEFSRVHVGRINGLRGLRVCAAYGVESCDGTGWFRGNKKQLEGLETFLYEQKYRSV